MQKAVSASLARFVNVLFRYVWLLLCFDLKINFSTKKFMELLLLKKAGRGFQDKTIAFIGIVLLRLIDFADSYLFSSKNIFL